MNVRDPFGPNIIAKKLYLNNLIFKYSKYNIRQIKYFLF